MHKLVLEWKNVAAPLLYVVIPVLGLIRGTLSEPLGDDCVYTAVCYARVDPLADCRISSFFFCSLAACLEIFWECLI